MLFFAALAALPSSPAHAMVCSLLHCFMDRNEQRKRESKKRRKKKQRQQETEKGKKRIWEEASLQVLRLSQSG